MPQVQWSSFDIDCVNKCAKSRKGGAPCAGKRAHTSNDVSGERVQGPYEHSMIHGSWLQAWPRHNKMRVPERPRLRDTSSAGIAHNCAATIEKP
eukprot:scaffold123284_cov32-Tisochrysis_lutea.AAC.3